MTTASDDMKDRHPEKRSKLDEIVEETMRDWTASGGMDTELFKRIAERSFRHGVERAVADTLSRRRYGNGPWIDHKEISTNVQPAPASAEEKRKEWCPSCLDNWCQKHCPDRRKGERRKGVEFHNAPAFIYPHEGKYTYGFNRRCSERRKPKVSYAHE